MAYLYNLAYPIDWESITKPVYADTNVIVDMYYPNSGLIQNPTASAYQVYHQFIRQMFQNKMKLHIASHVLLEMEIQFTKYDYNLYNIQHPMGKIGKPKEYRNLPTEQCRRKQIYGQVFEQIMGNEEIICSETKIPCAFVQSFIASLDKQAMDPNDFILAEICKSENAMLLTNDKDFATPVVQCDLITNNQDLIAQGLVQGFVLANPVAE